MSRKAIGVVALTNAAATTVAVHSLTHAWPAALAAGALSAILVRIALALSVGPRLAPARRNVSPTPRFGAGHSRLED